MASYGSLGVNVYVNTAGMAQQVTRATVQAGEQAGRAGGSALSKGLSAAIKGGLVAGGLVAAAGTAIAKFGIQSAASLETTTTAFTSLLGSSKAATDQISQLQKFAAKTPFSQQDVLGYAQQYFALANSVGMAQDQVIPFLTSIGDVAAVTGASTENIHNAVMAIGQIGSAGKLTLENLNQISEAFPGFNAAAAIASATGQTTADVLNQIHAGTLSAAEGIPALIKGMQDFQGAAGAMAKQSQTLSGLWSTFTDTIQISLTQAFTPIIPVIKQTLDTITPVVKTAMAGIAPALGSVIQALAPAVGPLISGLGQILTTTFNLLGPILSALIPLVKPLVAAFQAMLPPVATVLQLFADMAATILPPLVAVFTDVVNTIRPVIEQLAHALAPVFPVIAQAIKAMMPVVQQLADAFAGSLLQVIQTLVPLIPKLVPAFASIADAVGQVMTALAPLIPVLVDALAPIIPVIADAITALMPSLQAFVGALGAGLQDAITAIAPALPGLAEAFGSLAGSMSDLLTALSPMIGPFLQFIGAIVKIGAGALTDIIRAVSKLVGWLSDLIEMSSKVTGAITGLVGNIPGVKQLFHAISTDGGAAAKVIQDATTNVKDFTDALVASNGVLTQTIKLTAAKKLQDSGLAEKAAKAGISLKDLTKAVTGNEDQVVDMITRWKKFGGPSDETILAFIALNKQFGYAKGNAYDLLQATGQLPPSFSASATAAENLAGVTGAVEQSLHGWRLDIDTAPALEKLQKLYGAAVGTRVATGDLRPSDVPIINKAVQKAIDEAKKTSPLPQPTPVTTTPTPTPTPKAAPPKPGKFDRSLFDTLKQAGTETAKAVADAWGQINASLKGTKKTSEAFRAELKKHIDKLKDWVRELGKDKGDLDAANKRLQIRKDLFNQLSDQAKAYGSFVTTLERIPVKDDPVNVATRTYRLVVASAAQTQQVLDSALQAAKNIQTTTDDTQKTRKATATDFIADMRKRVDATVAFYKNVNKLRKAGLNKSTLQEIIKAGPQAAGQAAAALAAGGDKAVTAVNKQQKRLTEAAKNIGAQGVNQFYKIGINQAQAQVDGLEAQLKKDRKRIDSIIQKNVIDVIKKKLGIKSPSTVMHQQVGIPIGQGVISGLDAVQRSVDRRMNRLVGVPVTRVGGVSGYAGHPLGGGGGHTVNVYPRADHSEQAIGRAVSRELGWMARTA
jgi:tape measure domain-containing protein